MLTIVSAGKFHVVPSFIALFFLVLGAHALHPNFHEHPVSQHVHEHGAEGFKAQSYSGAVSFSFNGVHQTCPICDFLAVCSATDIGFLPISTPLCSPQRVGTDYQLSFIPAHQTGFQIRGPPEFFLLIPPLQ